MDITSIASAASAYQNQQTADAVGILVLRKALDAQSAAALALVQALPQPTPVSSLPPNLGRNLNVVA